MHYPLNYDIVKYYWVLCHSMWLRHNPGYAVVKLSSLRTQQQQSDKWTHLHSYFTFLHYKFAFCMSDWLLIWDKGRFFTVIVVLSMKCVKFLNMFCWQIATNRRTMQFSPPSMCIVEINIRGVKIIVQDECQVSGRVHAKIIVHPL